MSDALFRDIAPLYMRKFMADFDCTLEDAAAVFGNAGHESAGFTKEQEIKPTVAGSRGGWGWFQWTGPRRRAFEGYCARNKLNPASPEANYAWLFLELKGSEKRAIPALKAAGSLNEKVIAFENAYERSGVKHYDSRKKWAAIAMDAFRANNPPEQLPSPTPPPPQTAKNVGLGAAIMAALIAGFIALMQWVF
jgi:hypothetical protein